MKINITIISIYLLIPFCLFSQQETWQKRVDYTNLADIVETSDRGFITTGFTGETGISSACLLKLSSSGDKLWSTSFGETQQILIYSVDTTLDKGYIITGIAAGDLQGENIYVAKTNGFGELEWAKKYGDTGELAFHVSMTKEGGFILGGISKSYGAGESDVFILKIDSNGEVQWSRTFGNTKSDVGLSICETADSGFAILTLLSDSSSMQKMGVIKTNSTGKTLWSNIYVDTFFKTGWEIVQTKDHNLAIGGTANDDFYIMLIDSLGNFKWAKYYGTPLGETAYTLFNTQDNGFIISGVSNGFDQSIYPLALKVNSNGDQEWCSSVKTQKFGVVFSVIQTTDGAYVFAGEEDELFKLDSLGENECWLTKEILNVSEFPTIQSEIHLAENSPIISAKISNTVVRPEVNVLTVCTPIATKVIHDLNRIEIVPNPAASYFSIHSDFISDNTKVSIFDLLGVEVYSKIISDNEQINCENLSNGIYIVRVKIGEGFVSSKLVVNRR